MNSSKKKRKKLNMIRILCGSESNAVLTKDDHCPECGTVKGMRHHKGCDLEECPKCGGQMIACGCCQPSILS